MFLSEKFRKEFGFDSNVNVVFQRFDEEWNENIDLDAKSMIKDKDKLNAVIVQTPTIISENDKKV